MPSDAWRSALHAASVHRFLTKKEKYQARHLPSNPLPTTRNAIYEVCMLKRWLKMIAYTLVIGSLLAYGLVVAAMYMRQDSLYYPAPRAILRDPAAYGLAYQEVQLQSDREQLYTWFIPADGPKVVLFFHGNGSTLDCSLPLAEFYHQHGYSVFVAEYRGYGKSTGAPSEQGLYQDAQAAWDYLRQQRGYAESQILLHGESLGGAVAIWLAAQYPVAGLVTEGTFTRFTDVSAPLFPWLPVRLLSKSHFPSIERISQVNAPFLLMHSTEDRLIPYSHGQTLFAAASASSKQFVTLRGEHTAGLYSDGETYRQNLAQFLAQIP
jgi:alpha-beta hydrolase superfamily lysophospholipase